MKTLPLFIAVFFGMFVPAICQSQELLSDSIVKKLRIGAQGFKERYHSPSMVMAIVHDQNIIFSEAIGCVDFEHNLPATMDTKYSLQSLTKVFTATMLMQLVQNGTVSLNDEVKKFVPEFSNPSFGNTNEGTTLFQLATHTAGLPRNSPADITFTTQIDKWLLGGLNLKAIEAASNSSFLHSLKFVNKEYPDYQLMSYGDRHYSNLGYALLGIALEKANKIPYPEYIIKRICRPLHMYNSCFYNDSSRINNAAKGYYYDEKINAFNKVPVFKPNSAMPAGGMYASANDLAKFISFQFNSNPAIGNTILSYKNKAMMWSFRIGWKSSYPFVLHEGSMLGYRCEMVLNPEMKIGWVILTNTTDFDFSKMNPYIWNLLEPVYKEKPERDLEKFVGNYALPGGYDSLKIYLKKDSLYCNYLEKILPEKSLIPNGMNRFKGPQKKGYAIEYEFIFDDKSNIKALNMGQLMWIKSKS